MNLKYYCLKIQDVSLKDCRSIFPMMCALILLPFVKSKYKNTWVVCERNGEAQDNGYRFFQYMIATHPEQECIYYMNKNCKHYKESLEMGKVEKFGGVKHWIAYFSAKYLISSHSFMPNSYVCTLIEKSKLFIPNHVFLQHGITKDKADFLQPSRTNVKYFITGAEPEDRFMREFFKYPDDTLVYAGFPRFDILHTYKVVPGRIVIMPTWRKWLKLKSERHSDIETNISTSEYVRCWKEFIHNEKFIEVIKKHHFEVLLSPHANMKALLDIHDMTNEYVHNTEEEIPELLKTAQLMITDYSSVFFDMVYMKKPVIFYQFDEEKYRGYHYAQGWFDYHSTSFGKSCSCVMQVIEEIENLARNGFKVSESFLYEHSQVFPLYDTNNSKRIYEKLKEE